jgi:uncharacterized protein YnzC (UPF0291/DUF896 family)
MKRYFISIALILFVISFSLSAMGMQKHDENHGTMSSDQGEGHKMDHSGGHFMHTMTVDGVHSEFQIMSLKSMNMSDPEGKTHHIMVKMYADNKEQPFKNAIGKIKVIAPDGNEQVNSLKNYNGILAANFNFPQKGKYGVILLSKIDDQKRIYKFHYMHH